MKTVYTIVNDKGEVQAEGTMAELMRETDFNDRDIYCIARATEMGIRVYKSYREPKKPKPKKESTLAMELRTRFKANRNTVLGEEVKEKDLKEALEALEEDGIRATYKRSESGIGWYLERESL